MTRPGIDYIGVGVGVVLLDSQNRAFAAQRGPEAKNEVGTWEFPGGAVKYRHTLEATIIREMQEEYGIVIKVTGLLDVCDHIIPDEGQHWVSPSYLGKIVSGTPRIMEPHKCTAIGWFTLEELESMLLSIATRHNMRSLRQKHPYLV